MDSDLRFNCRTGLACLIALLMVVVSRPSSADSIDLSLNVFYANQFDANSGGTWQLAVKTGGRGLVGLDALITGINPNGTQFIGPSGVTNIDDQAGFSLQFAEFRSTHWGTVLSQVPLLAGDPEQTVFYGVGSVSNPNGAVPNYAGKSTDHPDAGALGPEYQLLRDLENELWGTGDPLGDSDWDQAAIMVEGTFDPGQTPSFFSDAMSESTGTVFTTVPSDPENLGSFGGVISASTTVRTNLMAVVGDFNEDGFVDLADYTFWRNNLGMTVVPPGTGIDVDGSGTVDQGDYDLWRANYGAGTSPGPISSSSNTAVPEPGAAILVLVFSCFLYIYRRLVGQTQEGWKSFSLNSLNTGETA